ncbi:hypothetical protein F5Y16DRAFT_385424 [Xylariaceae sp. FL0255]|nr:hypothetical protein F5Y16DRAFT_385424 [Xylariaceae sp. FL0255]
MPPSIQPPTGGSLTVMSPDGGAVRIDPADQKEIDAIWNDVRAKVVELAGGDPKKVNLNLSINDVLKYIDDTQKADDKKSAKYGTFKSIVGKTLQCIQTVGGIVASGVSNVFAPAGMAYSALTFVISAWQGYTGTFENLGELLEKCVEFFERLESYQGRMDSRMIRLASQNLRLFVQICDRTIKLRKKHTRLLRFAEQLFLNDDGVQDLLGMMSKLNSKESLLVGAQTYRLVSDTAGDVKIILNEQNAARREDEAKKWRRSIAKSLGFPGTSLDADGEPIPSWQRAFDTRMNSLVEGTGTWWRTLDVFSRWAMASSVVDPILLLSGKGGTGKTSMMANTIKSIRRLGLEAPTTRVVAAYYFTDGDKRKPDEVDEGDFLERVSRTLLWQIGISYEAMTRSMASVVEKAGQFNGTLDRWDQLFFNNKESQNSNTSFYLFIDATDADMIPLLERLVKSAARTQTRIFLTGRPEVIADHLTPQESVRFSTVPVTEHNGPDIDKYIISHLDSIPMFKDTSRPGISEWRQVILDELREKCEGDYFKLNNSLKALAKVDLVEDIREVLAEAGKTRLDQIDAELRRLNSIRTIKEIREINEIITWIDTGRWYFNIETMEAILSVKHFAPIFAPEGQPQGLVRRQTSQHGLVGPPASLATISLLPLSQKLKEKYPIFSVNDAGSLEWRSFEIKGRIPARGYQDGASTEGEAPQRSRVIQESEISIVKHFLGNVCPPELYERFEFEEFFNTKLGARLKEYISLDPDNSHIKIIFTCLVILTEVELRTNTQLRYYAMYWLMEHMQEVDLSAADREQKAQIGPLVVRLFTEDCGVDSLFWPFDLNVSAMTWEEGEESFLREARIEWVYSSSGVREISRWIQDSSVTRYITSDVGKHFVEGVKTSTNLHQAVLSSAARHIAKHLFLHIAFTKRHFLSGASFLRAYLIRLDGKEPKMNDDPNPYRDTESEEFQKWEASGFSLSQLNEIEAWCCVELSDTAEKDKAEKRQLLEKLLGPGADSQEANAVKHSLHKSQVEESLWEIHGALLAFQLCENADEKKEVSGRRAQKALELNSQNWHACHFVSGQPFTTKEHGIELLTRAKDAIDAIRAKDQMWMQDSNNTALIARITLDLGSKLWDSGQLASGAQKHRESLTFEYVRFTAYEKVLRRYKEGKQWGEFIAFINTWNETREIWDAFFDELVNDFIDAEDENGKKKNLEMLAEAADAANGWEVIKTFFNIATDIGNKAKSYDLVFLLRSGFANILELTSGTVDQELIVSVRADALELIKSHPSDTLSRDSIAQITDALGRAYLDKAFLPNTPTDRVESLGTLLAGLLPDSESSEEVYIIEIATICCFIRYHHKRNTKSNIAQRWIQRIIRAGIELLSDSDDDNDHYAYFLLSTVFTSIEDNRNNRISWAMRNCIQDAALSKWGELVTSPIESGTRIRPSFATFPLGNGSTPHVDSFSSTNGKERLGTGATPSPHGEMTKEPEQLARTATIGTPNSNERTSSAPGSRPKPARISTETLEPPTTGKAPAKPTPFVYCDGVCGREWTVVDEVLCSCADCVGIEQLCRDCHALLLNDQLKKKDFHGSKTHKYLELQAWDAQRFAGIPPNCVPLPDDTDANGRPWITLEAWKSELKKQYLPDDGRA